MQSSSSRNRRRFTAGIAASMLATTNALVGCGVAEPTSSNDDDPVVALLAELGAAISGCASGGLGGRTLSLAAAAGPLVLKALIGGPGADTLSGGAGIDTCVTDSGDVSAALACEGLIPKSTTDEPSETLRTRRRRPSCLNASI